MCLQRLVVHTNYTATFVSIYMVAVDAVVASGWGHVGFWKSCPHGLNNALHCSLPAQRGGSGTCDITNNASGVGGKMVPDAAREKRPP